MADKKEQKQPEVDPILKEINDELTEVINKNLDRGYVIEAVLHGHDYNVVPMMQVRKMNEKELKAYREKKTGIVTP